MPTASTVEMIATIRLLRKRLGYCESCDVVADPQHPLAAVVDRASPTTARRRRPPGRPACVSCTRLVKSLTKGVISGVKKTVGGTEVATARGLKAVEAIQ